MGTPGEGPDRTFLRLLVAITAGALAVRTIYALGFAPGLVGLDDDTFYHQTALELADGHGYVGALDVFTSGEKAPTADHPPMYALLLSFLGRAGARTLDAQRMLGVSAGTVTVFVVGLLGQRVAGRRAGLAAALLCAVYPAFIASDAALMSETLFGCFVAVALLLALMLLDRPRLGVMAALGVVIGLAALTRSEGLLLVPLLALPIALSASARRVALVATITAATALTVAPWVIRNIDVFGEPVYSTNDGATLAGANCEPTYYGSRIAGFVFECLEAVPQPRTTNRAVRSRYLRDAAVDYVRDRPGRAVVVAGLRLARLWGFYDPGDQVRVTGRDPDVQRIGVILYYPLLVAGVAAAVLLLRRREILPLAVLTAPVLLASLTAIATYGLLRLRHVADISLLVLAGVAVARLLQARMPLRAATRPRARA